VGLGVGAGVVGVVGDVGFGDGFAVPVAPELLDAGEFAALTTALLDVDDVEAGSAVPPPHPEIIAAATAIDAVAAKLVRTERVKCIVPPKPRAG
jgi:hypothetical protein